jgi:hypothetical protein
MRMRKIILALVVVVALSISLAAPVFAGGDKVRGEKAIGPANQVQNQDPPPFQP